jgi:hypothetical protein
VGDAVRGEELGGAAQESSTGGRGLVGVDFGVGQAAVVIDRGVHAIEPHPWGVASASVEVAVPAMDSPAAALAQPAEFLDIDMHQLARTSAFVAADHLPGRPVQPRQSRHAVPGQDSVHCRGRESDQGRDPIRAEFAVPTQTQHSGLDLRVGPARNVVGTAGPISQTRWAFSAVAGQPFVASRPRDTELGRHMSNRTTGQNTLDQHSATVHGQTGVTVDHRDLRVRV